MKVVLTRSAESDLLEIGNWIADDNPTRAATFLEELREACNRLADTPKAHPLVEGYKALGIRRRVFENYLVFYRIGPTNIEVLHILHGARDYEAILFADFG